MCEAIVRLKWHKGRILAEMDKQRPGEYQRLQSATVAPTYSELGIDKTNASREQLVKRAFDEDEKRVSIKSTPGCPPTTASTKGDGVGLRVAIDSVE